MPPESAAVLAVHEQRLDTIEQKQRDHDAANIRMETKIDALKGWIVAGLGASVLTLVGLLVNLLAQKL